MKTEGEAHLLRIYVNESDRWQGRPLHEMIVRAAKEKGLAGATALRGIEGYGTSGRVHSVKVLHLSEDVPIVVEIFDSAERIAVFLPVLDQMVAEGAVTIEKIHQIIYRRGEVETAEIHLEDEITGDDGPQESAGVRPIKDRSQNRLLRGGQAHFAPWTPQNEPVPDDFGIGPKLEFTDRAHQLLVAAAESAAASRRVYADSADVLLAMLSEARGVAAKALGQLGIDCRLAARSLRDTVSRDEAAAGYVRALKSKSLAAAKWLDDDFAGAEHLLLALCQIRPTAATDVLMRLGAQPRDICEVVLRVSGHEGDWRRWLADHPEL